MCREGALVGSGASSSMQSSTCMVILNGLGSAVLQLLIWRMYVSRANDSSCELGMKSSGGASRRGARWLGSSQLQPSTAIYLTD